MTPAKRIKLTPATRSGVQRITQREPWAGGFRSRIAKNWFGSDIPRVHNPTTNPVDGPVEEQRDATSLSDMHVEGVPGDPQADEEEGRRLLRQQRSMQTPSASSTARPVQETASRPRRKVKRHQDDLEEYPDDFYSHLTAEDIPDMNSDDLLIANDADLPAAARKCPINVRRMIRNAHNNLGHPSNAALTKMMRAAKCHTDMCEYARHMKCPSCARRQPPQRIPKASLPYRPTRFNAIVGLDLKWVKDSKGDMYYLLNILDLATAFNVCCIIQDKTPKTVRDAFKQYWLTWAGTPEKVVADKGTEYYTDFQCMLSDLGIGYRLVPVEAPWQHGMVERHGSVLADIINVTVAEHGVVGYQQMQDVALHTSMVKNRRPGRTGYSPRTLIFGLDERLVASGLNHYLEVPDDAAIAAANDNPVFKRSMAIRKSAMKAMIDLDHSEKWREAIKFPSRKAECALFLPGHQVFFWKKAQTAANLKGRRARLIERWWGPAVVIGHEWDADAQRDSYWVSWGGKAFLVSGTHMRHAEIAECLTQEAFLKEMNQAFQNATGTTFEYADVRRDQRTPDEVVRERSTQQPTAGLFERLGAHGEEIQTEIHQRTSIVPGSERSERIRSPDHRERTPYRSQPAEEPTPLNAGRTQSTPAVGSRAIPEHDTLPVQEESPKKTKKKNQKVFTMRGHDHVLVIDDEINECFFLKWKTFNKLQRKGRELDPKYFNDKERAAFLKSDAKEWQSFIDTGAVRVIPPSEARNVPQSRIFARSMRYVRTNKNKDEEGDLEAKSRIVTPGDVDPDGDIPVEDGGFRTDAPTCSQLAFHQLCSQAVLKKRRLGSFDCKTAFLTGKDQDRDIYCKPPKEGLPGVEPGSLLQLVKGAYGLREAPRLWYLRAREILAEAGFEEMQTVKACWVIFDRSGKEPRNVGMLVLHVDDACFAGEGPVFEQAMNHLRKKFTIGKEEYDSFDFLGRHVVQNPDFSIELDQHQYVQALTSVAVNKARRSQPTEKLTAKELHDYRSIVGQLAWPARETMPQLSYLVSDLQQKVAIATVKDLVHANYVLRKAKHWALVDKQKLVFRDLGPNVTMSWEHSMPKKKNKENRGPNTYKSLTKQMHNQGGLGMAAVHDASFMQQPKDGSQSAYCLMLCSTDLYEGKARTHLLDWGSSKIHRKVRSTLAAEAASAAKAFDRATYARAMWYEIENGWTHKWDQLDVDDCNLRNEWQKMCREVPFSLGTDCKSLYDVCTKNGSMPDERRVALDLLDVRESIEEMGDKIRWIPTDHMLVDCMTKDMDASVMLNYLKTQEYAFKFDDVIKNTKRELAKARKAAKGLKQQQCANAEEICEEILTCGQTSVEAPDLYATFWIMYTDFQDEPLDYDLHICPDWNEWVNVYGYREAYTLLVETHCDGKKEPNMRAEV